MSAIKKAISEVMYRIPRAILEKTFIRNTRDWRSVMNTNLDEQIMDLVVKPRVLVDCNLIGGTQALIPLSDLPYDKPNEYSTVIHIPKARTQGRSINSVLNVSFLSHSLISSYSTTTNMGGSNPYNSGENSAMMGAAVSMMAAMDKIPVTSTANVQLISENTILIKDSYSVLSNGFLRCILSNDENLNNIQIRSYIPFAKLVEYAVKSYIYNELIIEVDTAELQGGQTLGIFKTVLEGYSDAEENYQTYLKEKWEAIAFMNDQHSYNRLIKLTLGSR